MKESGGIVAIEGFDYQAKASLERMLVELPDLGPQAEARPEGVDDLDLRWPGDGGIKSRHIQIKKPRTDKDGNPKATIWSLSDVCRHLMPDALAHAASPDRQQVWLLGDAMASEVHDLVNAGRAAPSIHPHSFWTMAHRLAATEVRLFSDLSKSARQSLGHWKPSVSALENSVPPGKAVRNALSAENARLNVAKLDAYERRLATLAPELAAVLERIEILDNYGSEQELTERLATRLRDDFDLELRVVNKLLARQLRGFILDVSRRRNHWIDLATLRAEVAEVWPKLVVLGIPAPLPSPHVARPRLLEPLVQAMDDGSVEVVAASGVGKSVLATELYHLLLQSSGTDRIVLHAHVRATDSFRDLLVGLGLVLRRQGQGTAFRALVERVPDRMVLARCASALRAMSLRIALVVDLVDGHTLDAFANDLAEFLRAGAPVRFAFFGQTSSFRSMSNLEQRQHGLHNPPLPGLDFEEFVRLRQAFGYSVNLRELYRFWELLSARRDSGVPARLAVQAAREPDLGGLSELIESDPTQTLETLDLQKFSSLMDHQRHCASLLCTLALPFTIADAQSVFPQEPVRATVEELLARGLLLRAAGDAYEFHETVRRGLEAYIPPEIVKQAHTQLAQHYVGEEQRPLQIHHLVRAGEAEQAKELAREMFLAGLHWPALSPFVQREALLSNEELCDLLVAGVRPHDYLVAEMLASRKDPEQAPKLFAALESRVQMEQVVSGLMPLLTAILASDPKKINQVVPLLWTIEAKDYRRAGAISELARTLRAGGFPLPDGFVATFNQREEREQQMMLPLLLSSADDDAYRTGLRFVQKRHFAREEMRDLPWPLTPLLSTEPELCRFVTLLPEAAAAQDMMLLGIALGGLADSAWKARTLLVPVCRRLLDDHDTEEGTRLNALRLLLFLGDSELRDHSAFLAERTGLLQAHALTTELLLGHNSAQNYYHERCLDLSLPMDKRLSYLSMAAMAGVDLEALLEELLAHEGHEANKWHFGMILAATTALCPPPLRSVEALFNQIDTDQAETAPPLAVAAIHGLGLSSDPARTALLCRFLASKEGSVRLATANTLSYLRDPAALPALRAALVKETVARVRPTLAWAIAASRPKSVDCLPPEDLASPSAYVRLVLIGRLGVREHANELFEVAADAQLSWKVRRSCLLGLGRLSAQDQLRRLVPIIAHERSPFLDIDSIELYSHQLAIWLLESERRALAHLVRAGRSTVIATTGDLYTSYSTQLAEEYAPLLGNRLYDELHDKNNPAFAQHCVSLLKAAHSPFLIQALSLSLRRAGMGAELEELLGSMDHPWTLTQVLGDLELSGPWSLNRSERIRELIDQCRNGDHICVMRAVEQCFPLARRVAQPKPTLEAATPPPKRRMHLSDVEELLSDPRRRSLPVDVNGLDVSRREDIARLAFLLAPENDSNLETTQADTVKVYGERYAMGRKRQRSTDNKRSLRVQLRGMLAASAGPTPNIAWHIDCLRNKSYVLSWWNALPAEQLLPAFLGALDQLLPLLGDVTLRRGLAARADRQFLGLVRRFARSGGVDMLHFCCLLAAKVHDRAVDDVLKILFFRCVGQLQADQQLVRRGDEPIWSAFTACARHPRLAKVPGAAQGISSLLLKYKNGWQSEKLLEILEPHTSAYAHLELAVLNHRNPIIRHISILQRADDITQRAFDDNDGGV